MTFELGFLGFGNMARAIAAGVVEGGVCEAGRIAAFDPAEASQLEMERLGVTRVDGSSALAEGCRFLILAVKPQIFGEVAGLLGGISGSGPCIVSIMAGISLAGLEAAAGPGGRVIRVMPNTPLMVGAGMTAISRGVAASDGDVEHVLGFFAAAGKVVEVPESLMDAVTATSGSGPAYLFYLAEAMIQGGCEAGLDAATARLLVAQTLLGASRMLAECDLAPEELRAQVTSKGGTTAAATEVLDRAGVKEAWAQAMRAAAARSRELSG